MKAPMFSSKNVGKLLILFLVVSMAGLGCSTVQRHPGPEAASPDGTALSQKKVEGLELAQERDEHILVLTGGPDLLCSHFKKADPLGLSLYFPQTVMEVETPEISDDHPVIDGIQPSQLSAGGSTGKILVTLKKDVGYRLEPNDTGLRIVFQNDTARHEDAASAGAATGTIVEASIAASETRDSQAAVPVVQAPGATGKPASQMESIDALVKEDGTEVVIYADGSIGDFKSFTINDPPRIVFDLHRIGSPFEGLQSIAVASPQVKMIRHFGHPDKVRLVLDTQPDFLTGYSTQAMSNGLRIRIGSETGLAALPEGQLAATASAASEAETAEQPVWLNKIEFSSQEEGASSVLIGTTEPVTFEMEEVGPRDLRLKLYQTRVPEHRKRPLITTRFNSAVDRVTPVQMDGMGDTAVVQFQLREAVPFEIAQENRSITVRFAASGVPPKPLEQTQLPEWQKAIESEGSAAPGRGGETHSGRVVAAAPSTAASTAVASSEQGAEVYQERQDTIIDSEYDLGMQRRVDEVTGEEEPLDLYQTRTFKRYTGEKIALNFYETDIKNVFRILGEISQQNFAIDKDVSGRVTLNFEKPVPWDQVLDLVLKMNKLGRTMEGDIVRIATLETLAQEEAEQRRKLAEKQAREDQEDLATIFLRLSYIDAFETARDHLIDNPDEPQGKWISKFNPDRGKVSVDPKQNMIVVTDIPRAVKRAKEIVTKLDKVTPQVLIEARLVETTTEFSREMGFDWGNVSIGSFGLGDWGEITGINLTASNPTTATPTGSLSFGFSKLGGTSFDIVDATLEVFERQGETKTISSPKVLTLDGKQATISQGFDIPYEERDSAGGSSIAFKEALLQLQVTPQVTPDDRISLKLDLTRDDVTDITLENPPLTTNVVKTELLVEDGETIVIGGIIKADLAESEEGIPGLMNVPGLGYLFKTKGRRDSQTELLIFLTPKIIKLGQKEILG